MSTPTMDRTQDPAAKVLAEEAHLGQVAAGHTVSLYTGLPSYRGPAAPAARPAGPHPPGSGVSEGAAQAGVAAGAASMPRPYRSAG